MVLGKLAIVIGSGTRPALRVGDLLFPASFAFRPALDLSIRGRPRVLPARSCFGPAAARGVPFGGLALQSNRLGGSPLQVKLGGSSTLVCRRHALFN